MSIARSFNKLLKLLSLFLALSIPNYAQVQVPGISTGGTQFLIYTPPGYNAAGSYPLLVYLHGGASIGNDLNELFVNHRTPPRLINDDDWSLDLPFIVVSPLLPRDLGIPNPNDQEWPVSTIQEVISHVSANYGVDNQRVYLTGISLGGAACWEYAATFPTEVAAIVPISGKTDLSQACSLTDIPIWAFHGASDGLVNPDFSVSMIDSIKACTPGSYSPNLSLLQARRHEGWNEVYQGTSGYRIYDWMLQFVKSDLSNKPPYVNAGFDKSIALRDGEFNAFFEFLDWDSNVSQINWTKLSGPQVVMTSDIMSPFLSLSQLNAGTYEFRLEVTDSGGASNSDTLTIEVLPGPVTSEAGIDSLILFDGETGQEIGLLTEGEIINLNTLNTSRLNFEAIANDETVSVLFQINGSHYTFRTGNSDPYFFRNPGQINANWQPAVGEYQVCATAYSQNAVRGAPGVSQCHKIAVFDQPRINFYQQHPDVTLPSSWNDQLDGSGNALTSFAENFNTYHINQPTVVASAWDISAAGSYLKIEENQSLSLNNTFSGTINADAGTTISINSSSAIRFDSLNTSSTVIMSPDMILPTVEYGNLLLTGANSTKTLPPGLTKVKGDLTIESDVTLNGNAIENSQLEISGNLTDNGDAPADLIDVSFDGGGIHELQTTTVLKAYNSVELAEGTSLELNSSVVTTLTLGTLSGGGLLLSNNAELNLGANSLHIEGNGSINPLNTSGLIAIDSGNLNINSGADQHSHVNLSDSEHSINTLDIDMSGSGQLFVYDTLDVLNGLNISNGTVNTGDVVRLRSDANSTAYIGPIQGTGAIAGDLVLERYMDNSLRLYKYMASPIIGTQIIDWQEFIPITGAFPGSSPGFSTNPSLYHYDALSSNWEVFPQSSVNETFELGKGYAVFLRSNDISTPLVLTGAVHTGDYSFQISPDTDPVENNDGWNLLGNPYAAPIFWNNINWTRQDVNNTIYVRDNTVQGGRFLVWDSDGVGDPEFGGEIALGQAFWVRSTGLNPELIASEGAKLEERDVTFFRKQSGDVTGVYSLALSLNHGSLSDRTYVKFSDSYSEGFNPEYDAVKRFNGYFNIYSLSDDSVALVINNTSSRCDVAVNLALESSIAGDYTIALDQMNMPQEAVIWLYDNLERDSTQLLVGESYSFKIDQLNEHDVERFKLRIIYEFEHHSILPDESSICEKNDFSLELDQLSSSFNYSLYLNNERLEKLVTEKIVIPTSTLAPGEHEVVIKGNYKHCSFSIADTLTLKVNPAPLTPDYRFYFCSDSLRITELSSMALSDSINIYLIENDKHIYFSNADLALNQYNLDTLFYELNRECSNSKGLITTDIDTLGCTYVSNDVFYTSREQVIKIRPNPVTKGHFELLLNDADGKLHYSITDLKGKVVMAGALQLKNSKATIELDKSLKRGMYLFRIETENQVHQSKIFIHP